MRRFVRGTCPRILVVVGLLAMLVALTVADAGAGGSGKKPKPRLPDVVYIRFQLSESFTHTQPNQHWTSRATIDEVQEATPADLRRDSIVHALLLRSSELTAETTDPSGTCAWRGKLASGAAPEIALRHFGHKTYGLVSWPDQAGPAWHQTLVSGSRSTCPGFASFSPVQGPSVLSSPSIPNSTDVDRFYNATFPLSVQRGQRKINVAMSSSGDIPGEVDDTRALGLITISYGRCPSPLKRCKPTNGKP